MLPTGTAPSKWDILLKGIKLIPYLPSLYGDSEKLLSKWFKRTGKRDQIFLATKFGFVREGGMSHHKIDSSGAYCKQACAKSLEALGVNCIDLYYMHRANREVPVEETMRAMAELKA